VLSINGPVALGGVLVRPGDWVVGDRDGVCVVPVDQVRDLLAAATGRAA
jgi:4-hydroxy-4-methyl-2-oxoglutarate aldolase